MKKILKVIADFFSTSNTINENVVMGLIVFIYIAIAYPLGVFKEYNELLAWMIFDASFWGIGFGKSLSANGLQ